MDAKNENKNLVEQKHDECCPFSLWTLIRTTDCIAQTNEPNKKREQKATECDNDDDRIRRAEGEEANESARDNF